MSLKFYVLVLKSINSNEAKADGMGSIKGTFFPFYSHGCSTVVKLGKQEVVGLTCYFSSVEHILMVFACNGPIEIW